MNFKGLSGHHRMNILFLSQIVPYPPHGGVLQRGYNLIREIGRRNSVYLLAFVHPEVLGNAELLDASRKALSEHCRQIEYFELWPKKSKLHRAAGLLWGGISGLPFSVLAHRSRAFKASMSEILRRETIDLVHYDTLALAQFADDATGVPKVLTHHNIESQLMSRRADTESNPLAKWYLAREATEDRRLRARAVRQVRPEHLRLGHGRGVPEASDCPTIRTEVIPNGVDLRYFKCDREDEDPGKPTLIYTGGMNMYANRDAVMFFLREIWPAIKQGMPGVTVLRRRAGSACGTAPGWPKTIPAWSSPDTWTTSVRSSQGHRCMSSPCGSAGERA